MSHLARNSDREYSELVPAGAYSAELRRYVGRCKSCKVGHKLEGHAYQGRRGTYTDFVVIASNGAGVFTCADLGTNPSSVHVRCACNAWMRLAVVYDRHRPNQPRHECSSICTAAKGPACDCKCKGANHGRDL